MYFIFSLNIISPYCAIFLKKDLSENVGSLIKHFHEILLGDESTSSSLQYFGRQKLSKKMNE